MHLFSRPPWFVSQNAGCTPIRFCLTDAAPGEMGFTSNSEDALELSGQGTEGDRDSGTAGGSARGRGRGAGPRRPPPSGNSGHFEGPQRERFDTLKTKITQRRVLKMVADLIRMLREHRMGPAVGEGIAPRIQRDRRVGARDLGLRASWVRRPRRLVAEGRPGDQRSSWRGRRCEAWLDMGVTRS